MSHEQAVADDGVFVDADEAGGLAYAAALGQVMQDGEGLVSRQAGIEQRRAFAFGEARLAGAGVQQPSLLGSVVATDGQVTVATLHLAAVAMHDNEESFIRSAGPC
jgi:hypothetical protein